ncbi:NAD(P)/FAD-dependent oxidoreductase [Roseomonas frigidaquae]|uniref:Thioredoxin reductase n=1 Tax=Falsiroseomonas frigidaquae TaxID=487318 RepID=A0ABX1F3T8_9PROT|nr:NAD(P)/FAD-dependent oxidoreductase [Falsiroseomonas frigidaquae]NKE47015.1 NAD(P)/FAD-dependent oxidoreductase [Falsiroseomonas frigidaquae]
MPENLQDCLIIGAGPAGMTAALYLARFKRRVLLVDAGAPRAAWIPTSHNIPFFAEGIGGPDLLARQREHLARYGIAIRQGEVTALHRTPTGFTARIEGAEASGEVVARRVLLATGAVDVEPELPDLPDAVRRGLVRYCPICDGYEARDRSIAVIGHGAHGLGEAAFIARTYSDRVTLLTLGKPLALDEQQRALAARLDIRLVADPITGLDIANGRVAVLRGGGQEHRFDVLYSALGLHYRSGLGRALGAEHDEKGALVVDAHNQTSVKGLYAAGDIVRGLDQIVIAMGHAAVAATHIHNRCELPTEDEEGG